MSIRVRCRVSGIRVLTTTSDDLVAYTLLLSFSGSAFYLLFLGIACAIFEHKVDENTGTTMFICASLSSVGTLCLLKLWVKRKEAQRLKTLRATEMPAGGLVPIQDMVARLFEALSLKETQVVWKWVPSDISIGACVVATTPPAVVISRGLLLAATRNHSLVEAILAHELAHVRNGDDKLVTLLHYFRLEAKFFFLLILAAAIFISLSGNGESVIRLVFAVFGGGIALIFWNSVMNDLLIRREYLADLRAINAQNSKIAFLRLLLRAPHSSAANHPTPQERAEAIARCSPVTRTSWTMIMVSWLAVGVVWVAMNFPFAILAIIAAVIVTKLEWSKGSHGSKAMSLSEGIPQSTASRVEHEILDEEAAEWKPGPPD